MSKIAINSCYGGFSISEEAVRLGRQISGDPKWPEYPTLPGELYEDGTTLDHFYGAGRDLDRQDATLIAVVERLGDKANGDCVKIELVEIKPGQLYRIDEYDGLESLKTPEFISWNVAA